MTIAVVGGTGMVGRRLVAGLRVDGHDVVVVARSCGIDTVTGMGLAEALDGVNIVIDVSSPGYAAADDMHAFFDASCCNLLEAERSAGVAHHIALSAVGTDRLGTTGYFRAKLLQERLVAGSAIPFTILRSTPFYEYLYGIVDLGGDGRCLHLAPLLMQPIAVNDVVAALQRIALEHPANAVIEIAGPDVRRLDRFAEDILGANEDPRDIVVSPETPYFGAHMQGEALVVSSGSSTSSIRFDDWLRESLEISSTADLARRPVEMAFSSTPPSARLDGSG
ncbi:MULTISPECIES: SDR family oxidoreductase [unclassified Sphingomonas]|uniref:SDR family oxidoreductase n=1 Tax=unclassified Sphingomonas TaxID=196159 RepID=UPI000FF002AD|nr:MULTISPECIES: SDR family oxidoreductase [unclassified Sphingomonas]RKE42347.1 uncharacterized protein YbjT (DUF2867 family) [Sphingomonas sp. PP-CC-1A-547]TCM03553.1 uncharacterized protein YbjT (DUF2867 family) [Sphingomonas sp. PP-CC-3G-468]